MVVAVVTAVVVAVVAVAAAVVVVVIVTAVVVWALLAHQQHCRPRRLCAHQKQIEPSHCSRSKANDVKTHGRMRGRWTHIPKLRPQRT